MMAFQKSTIPSVKAANKTQPPSTILLEGYLNKQKHGRCKAWLKRYFILYEDELRYYKKKNDTNPLAVISLGHYSLVPDAQPLTSMNSKQWKYHTFCLVSDDETKYNWPDYFLQAPSSQDRQVWVKILKGHITQSTSVLEKWLEKVNFPTQSFESFPQSKKSLTRISDDLLAATSRSNSSQSILENTCSSVASSTLHIPEDTYTRKALEVPIMNPKEFDASFDPTTHYYYGS